MTLGKYYVLICRRIQSALPLFNSCHCMVTPCQVEEVPHGMTTTRLQRRHFSSTPSGRNRANRFPQRQRLSCAVPEEAVELNEPIYGEIENHFQFHLSSVCCCETCVHGLRKGHTGEEGDGQTGVDVAPHSRKR
jgi:hypothetical protein